MDAISIEEWSLAIKSCGRNFDAFNTHLLHISVSAEILCVKINDQTHCYLLHIYVNRAISKVDYVCDER